ncbi:MAG: pyridoxamine 5'-phosphate oxidase family protein, partial [Pseudomonadota bacterium]
MDDDARRLAQTLLRTERHGALATLDPATGWPNASRVSVATAMDGHPLFLASQLSPHFGAMQADGRVSLLLGSPGKGDPLAHARMTVIGRAAILEGEARERNMRRFLARQPKAELYAFFGDFALWQLSIERVSLNGGFGKAYEMTAADMLTPEMPDLAAMEAGAVE